MRETESLTGLAVRRFTPERPAGLPPVLLVHGFGSDGSRDWVDTGIAAALAEAGREVFVPDLRGHGDSPAPASAAGAGAPALAGELVEVLDEAGVAEFDAVGYSL